VRKPRRFSSTKSALLKALAIPAGSNLPMDDRKWIAIMVASMLLLVAVAALLVQRPGW
jgi:hypothetical protein